MAGDPSDVVVFTPSDLQVSVRTRQRIQNDLAEALGAVECLKASARDIFLSILEERLGRSAITHENNVPHLFRIDLVRTCANIPAGLDDLAEVVWVMEQGSGEAARVRRVVDEWQALAAMPGLEAIWEQMETGMQVISLADVASRFPAVTGGRLVVPPPHCTTSWSAFLYLVALNSMPKTSPPWWQLLMLLRHRFQPRSADEIASHLRALAVDQQVIVDRPPADDLTTRVSRRGLLDILLMPNSVETGLFTLVYLYGWDGEGTEAVARGEDRTVSRSDLKVAVEDAVKQVERIWAERVSELRIEFILPIALLNEPVEWWPKDSSHPEQVPSLSLYHPVVIRSADRLMDPGCYGRWRNRWTRLSDETAPGEILWPEDPDREGHLSLVEAALMSNDGYVGMVLSKPPSPDSTISQELICALRVGVPFVAWHRDGRTDEAFRAVVETLMSPNIARVPNEVAKLRKSIEMLEPDDRDRHVARGLAILWDDARSIPRALLDASET